ncbi:MAG: formate dehydrogenase accessory protein FdhE [Actinobacteria bacterium]|nr:formate dehydrogenase accessory protein FdhE [Actinomycetota bacterium]MBU1943118.1 formate dehydrogenase accessory protein FdhE [Actinomycetota bacterium]MBU2687935.1 formate dehydrogenase accessory protein FdhE [Actinomycetota bacterium]
MIVETVDPGTEEVERVAEEYLLRYPDYSGAIALYGEVMKAQQEALEGLECQLSLDEEERQRSLLMGEPLVDPMDVPVERGAFLELFERLTGAVLEGRDSELTVESVLAWPGLGEERFEQTRRAVLEGAELSGDNEWSAEDRNVVSGIFWEALAPFYRKCGSILTFSMEQSMWQRGFCPFCGGAPLMGLFRRDDGLWLLECSLCHSWWNVPRASCPFCDESEGSLKFLYLEQDKGQRAYYCGSCGTYVKTVDLREEDRTTLLPMEDVVTAMLDRAAEEEGLERARGYTER